MATTDPNNILQTVATYQKAELARLLNDSPGISLSNKKFTDFNKAPQNLGATVTFDRAPRAVTTNGLIVSSTHFV